MYFYLGILFVLVFAVNPKSNIIKTSDTFRSIYSLLSYCIYVSIYLIITIYHYCKKKISMNDIVKVRKPIINDKKSTIIDPNYRDY